VDLSVSELGTGSIEIFYLINQPRLLAGSGSPSESSSALFVASAFFGPLLRYLAGSTISDYESTSWPQESQGNKVYLIGSS